VIAIICVLIGFLLPAVQASRESTRLVATCRQQGLNVLEYLTSCFEADRRGQSIRSLLPVTEPAIKVA
jgi:hypothetical protein